MKKYVLKLKHDNGVVNITIFADSMRSAIDMVCIAELCPRSAIKSVSSVCDECGKPSKRLVNDAALNEHWFCQQCWDAHAAFCGNDGLPYAL